MPDPADPNLYGWWNADSHITIQPGAFQYKVYTVGNKADYQVDKTDRVSGGCTNLVPTLLGREPYITRADNQENFIRSADMTNPTWSPNNVTIHSATEISFTAQNGTITIQIYGNTFDTLTAYKVSARIRRVGGSGNTNLQFFFPSSADTANITISDVSTYYEATFVTGTDNEAAVWCGLKDPNAAGWGRVEILEWSFRRADRDDTYLAPNTNGEPQFGCVAAAGIRSFTFRYADQPTALFHFNPAPNVVTSPYTLYFSCRPHAWTYPDRVLSMGVGVYDWFLSWEDNFYGKVRCHTTGAPALEFYLPAGTVANNTWCVLSAVINNGGTSSVRHNLDAAVTGALNDVAANGIRCWPGDPNDGNLAWHASYQCTDLIIRSVIDDAAAQEDYIRYLAGRAGLVL